jgi:hypothetical protein
LLIIDTPNGPKFHKWLYTARLIVSQITGDQVSLIAAHPPWPNILAAMANVDDDIRRVLDQIELGELLIDFQYLVELLMDFNEALARNDTSHEKYREPVARRRPPRKQRLETARRARSIPPSPSQE